MQARIPDEVIDRAIELIRAGRFINEAARAVGISQQGLSKRSRLIGIHVEDLRPSLSSHKGRVFGPRERRYSCRFSIIVRPARNSDGGKTGPTSPTPGQKDESSRFSSIT